MSKIWEPMNTSAFVINGLLLPMVVGITRPRPSIQLTKFDALYQHFKTDETFLSISAKTGQPSWGDAALFGLLWDHIITGHMTVEDLNDQYPHLAALFAAYHAIPAVNPWIETKLASKK
jgi:glutathione S-transferase